VTLNTTSVSHSVIRGSVMPHSADNAWDDLIYPVASLSAMMSRDNSRTACRNLVFSASRNRKEPYRPTLWFSVVLFMQFPIRCFWINRPSFRHRYRVHRHPTLFETARRWSVRQTSKNAKAIAANQPPKRMNQSPIARPKRPLDVIWLCRMKASPTGVV